MQTSLVSILKILAGFWRSPWGRFCALWVALPIAAAVYCALTAPNDNADMYDRIKTAREEMVSGAIKYSDFRRNNLKIITREGNVRVYCAPERRASSCMRGFLLDEPIVGSFAVSRYRGYPILIEVRGVDGNVILSKAQRLRQIRQRSEHASRQTPQIYARVGLVAGLLIAGFTQLMLILRRRNECR